MYHHSKLKNGINLITVPVKGTSATTVLCMFPVGSRYEDLKISGISHFVEHVMFKGTDKRPTSQEITRTFDGVGAQYNAFTSKEYTGYYVKIAGAKQGMAFDVLSDMIFHSTFKAEEIEKEKGAIVEELRMFKDNPLMDIDDTFETLMFEGNTLGWNIGGTEESVRGITREEMWNYYQRHYSPQTMVLVVAGALDTKHFKKFLANFTDKQAPKNATKPTFYKNSYPAFTLPTGKPLADRVAVKEKKVDQTQIVMGFPALPHNHPDRYAVAILTTILGGGMSSRLFSEVREKRGLAYMVKCDATSYRDTGFMGVKAGLDPARLQEAVKVIKQELTKITEEEVSARELKHAQNYLLGHIALQLEDSFNQANWFAEKFLFAKKIETFEHMTKELKKVTAKSVQRVAKKLINFDEMRVAAIGSFSKEQLLEWLA
jgi:predicted Zn-dependent peptidase